MRKIIFIAIFLLFISAPMTVLAQETPLGTQSAEPQSVDYTLPYPGLLPDSPLYIFKVIRDKIVGLLISDPIKKAEFDVLQADKRLEASRLLTQERPMKENLVADTLSKGENYFSDAIDEVSVAKKQGEDITDILGNMDKSNKKHLEVITSMEKNVPLSLQGKLDAQKTRVVNLGKLVNTIKPKK